MHKYANWLTVITGLHMQRRSHINRNFDERKGCCTNLLLTVGWGWGVKKTKKYPFVICEWQPGKI